MKERFLRQSSPSVQEGLQLARRLSGARPRVRWVDALSGGIHAELLRPARPGQPYEIVLMRDQAPIAEHLLLHEVGHLVRLHRVPPAERLQAVVTPANHAHVIAQLRPEVAALEVSALPADEQAQMVRIWHEGLSTQLVNFPADLRIEAWLHARFPGARATQRRALLTEVERSYPLFDPVVERLTPPSVYWPTMVMNAAQAVLVARLLHRPDLLEPFADYGFAEAGKALADLVFAEADEGHRSDIRATNAWAAWLDLEQWVRWVAPPVRPERA